MKKSILAALCGLTLLLSAQTAQAKLFEVWGSGLLGGGYGAGNGDKDFYKWASGGAAGVEVGAKILFLGGFIDYLRWFGGKAGANLLSFNLGGDSTFDLALGLALVFRLAGAYYEGGLPDDATLMVNNVAVKQVNTRGVGIHGGLGLRYYIAPFLSVGITPEIGYHYFFGGAGLTIDDQNSAGWDFQALAYARVGIGL